MAGLSALPCGHGRVDVVVERLAPSDRRSFGGRLRGGGTSLVYVSISSNWLGSERAKKITTDGSEHTVTMTADGKVQGGLSLAGRLGDSYVLWDPAKNIAILVPVDDVGRLEIARKPAPRAKVDQLR